MGDKLSLDNKIKVGWYFEPKQAYRLSSNLPYSKYLIKVIEIKKPLSENSVVCLRTHHGREFNSTVSWVLSYWESCKQ